MFYPNPNSDQKMSFFLIEIDPNKIIIKNRRGMLKMVFKI